MGTDSAAARTRALAPIAAALLAIALFSAMDAVMKHVANELGAISAVFWRNVLSTTLAGTLFFMQRTRWPEPAAWRMHALRALTMGVAAVAFFHGITLMPLADGVALSFIAPLLMVLFAGWLLGETIQPSAVIGCLLGLVGVVVIASGQMSGLGDKRALAGVGVIGLSAVSYALGQVMLRHQAQSQSPQSVAFIQTGLVTLGLAIPVGLDANLPPVSLWPWIATGAILATSCQLMLVWAYARAQAQTLAPLEYSAFLWAALFGWWLFGEPLTLGTLAGAALIVMACLAAARR